MENSARFCRILPSCQFVEELEECKKRMIIFRNYQKRIQQTRINFINHKIELSQLVSIFSFSANIIIISLGCFLEKNMAIIGKIDMYHFQFKNCAKKCQKEKFKNLSKTRKSD